MMMIVALFILLLLLKVSSQSINHNDHNDHDDDHEMFVRTYSSLFNSNTRKRYSSSDDIVNEHNRILMSFYSNRTSSSSSSSQTSFVLNLQQNCGSICHDKVSVYLNTLSSSSSSVFRPLSLSSLSSSSLNDDRYSIINVDKALVLASLDNIERLASRY